MCSGDKARARRARADAPRAFLACCLRTRPLRMRSTASPPTLRASLEDLVQHVVSLMETTVVVDDYEQHCSGKDGSQHNGNTALSHACHTVSDA